MYTIFTQGDQGDKGEPGTSVQGEKVNKLMLFFNALFH